MQFLEHPTFHLQWRQSGLQRLYHLGFYWSPENVPIWTSVQRHYVLFPHRRKYSPFFRIPGRSADIMMQPVVTIAVYLIYRRYPNSWVRYINVPIFFNAAGNIPPANTSMSFRPVQLYSLSFTTNTSTAQYSLMFITGFIFNYYIRQRAFAWWKRYNCQCPPFLRCSPLGTTDLDPSCRLAPGSYGYRHGPGDCHNFLCAQLQ